MRAMLRAFRHALPEIEREAAALGTLKRPRNASGQEAERDEFEARLAAAPLRARGPRASPAREDVDGPESGPSAHLLARVPADGRAGSRESTLTGTACVGT